jgi:hypothetical protein
LVVVQMNAIIPLPHFTGNLEAATNVAEVKRFMAENAALRAYAKEATDPSLEAYAVEWQMRAERKLGQLMAAQKSAGLMAKGQLFRGSELDPREDKPITLTDAGIDKHLAQRARESAYHPFPDN